MNAIDARNLTLLAQTKEYNNWLDANRDNLKNIDEAIRRAAIAGSSSLGLHFKNGSYGITQRNYWHFFDHYETLGFEMRILTDLEDALTLQFTWTTDFDADKYIPELVEYERETAKQTPRGYRERPPSSTGMP
jgi:hypothetical protein